MQTQTQHSESSTSYRAERKSPSDKSVLKCQRARHQQEPNQAYTEQVQLTDSSKFSGPDFSLFPEVLPGSIISGLNDWWLQAETPLGRERQDLPSKHSLIEIFSQTLTFGPFLHSTDNFLIREVISRHPRHLKECLRHMPRAPGPLSAHPSLGFTFCFGILASPRFLGVSHYMLWFIQKFWLNFFYK